MASYYPLKLTPILKDYIWGGRNLQERLGRQLPEGIIAESWEIAAHPDGTGTIANGSHRGKLLTELQVELGLNLIGTRSAWADERGKFPLLIKILDANRNLSVQVHPDDTYALANEGNELGKTEMWVIMHAEPGAKVILGVKEGTTAQQFAEAIEAGALEPFMHMIDVEAGDVVNVPAGSLHAILGGLLVAEIQQNSNTTYRVYDWNRLGHDGNPRQLHVKKAIDVINFDQVEPGLAMGSLISDEGGIRRELLNVTHYFTAERVTLEAGTTFNGICDGSTFEIWGTLSGDATASANGVNATLEAVSFTLLPAATGAFAIHAHQPTTLLRTYVGE